MSGRLPPGFDADWYAANYRDVELSGLSPQQHYRRFGRLLGRRVSASATRAGDPAEATAAVEADQQNAAAVPGSVARQRPKPNMPLPIIDRPEGFDPVEAVPQAASPRPGGDSDTTIALDAIAVGRPPNRAAFASALQSYARLVRLPVPVEENATVSCAAAIFQTGPARVDNAWLVDDSKLRLMLSGSAAAPDLLSIRAYQAEPGSPGDLQMLGAGIGIPPLGPVFHDFELVHPLMPVLLELAAADGSTRAIALMPFPSLLPGGLHSAELRALQNEPIPIDAFWSLSEVLLEEKVGRDGWADRSVTSVAVNGGEGLPQPVPDWLSALFDISGQRGQPIGLQLQLPAGSVPTISALTSRRLEREGAITSGPYLVAEEGSYRPCWSIALPADQQPSAAVPQLCATGASGDSIPASRLAPIHLAIALRSSHARATPGADAPIDGSSLPISANVSVVLSGSDADRVETLVEAIRTAVPRELEILLRTPDPSNELTAALNRACDGLGWAPIRPGADLREIASGARHATLLTISERISISGRTLAALLDLLGRDESAGSASCALLSEKIIKKQVVLQPASGGLFPAAVSFASAPRLSFGEPDAFLALPDLAYPVVANTLLLTVWRTAALAALPGSSGPIPVSGEDIRLGMDLMQAGYRNWCTSQVSARLSGPYAPRDMIDPIGAAYLQPERWEDILRRVALIRELS